MILLRVLITGEKNVIQLKAQVRNFYGGYKKKGKNLNVQSNKEIHGKLGHSISENEDRLDDTEC